jgi:hypothetical protein
MGFLKWLVNLFAVGNQFEPTKEGTEEYMANYMIADTIEKDLERRNRECDDRKHPKNPWDDQ